MDSFRLNTGAHIPQIGFGTWEIPAAKTASAVANALEAGYRLFDTAKIYGNEQGVGEALQASGLQRADYFLTTKLWNDDQGYDSALRACRDSLQRLGHDYLDLYLIHWPATSRRNEAWRAMEQLIADGTIKAAGVSNYTVHHLEELLGQSKLTPAVNQVEFHPFIYEQQRSLLKFCADHNIQVEAYSPLSRLNKTNIEPIQAIADELNVTPQQVVLRWCIQHGTIPLPRSSNPEHITANLDIFGFELSPDQMDRLNQLSDGKRVTWDPAGMGV